jgi:hypothetical protein
LVAGVLVVDVILRHAKHGEEVEHSIGLTDATAAMVPRVVEATVS